MPQLFKGIKLKMTAAIIFAALITAASLTTITYVLTSYALAQGSKTRANETAKILSEALFGRTRQLAIRTEIFAQDNDFQTSYDFRESELARLEKNVSDF